MACTQVQRRTLQIADGDEARTLLRSADFQQRWRDLHERCSWATTFQSAAYAAAWYESYANFHPVVLFQQNDEGALLGLLALAADQSRLCFPGDAQAEYHGWLALPDDSFPFMQRALAHLRTAFPGRHLHLRYAAPGLPLKTVLDAPGWRTSWLCRQWRRPLLHVGDGSEAAQTLHHKRHNFKLNRLQKEGPLVLRQLNSPAEMQPYLNDIIAGYDARHLEVHKVAPFASDPLKKQFWLALLREGLLQVSVLTVGDRLVAAHLGVRSGATVHLCISSYEARYGCYSPGRVLIYKMAADFPRHGITTFDLTPGGDSYKEDFANDHDVVPEVKLFLSPWQAWQERARLAARGYARRLLQSVRRVVPPTAAAAVSPWTTSLEIDLVRSGSRQVT